MELADDPHYRGLLLFSDGRVAVLSDEGFAVALTDFCDHDDCPGAANRYPAGWRRRSGIVDLEGTALGIPPSNLVSGSDQTRSDRVGPPHRPAGLNGRAHHVD